MSDEFGKHVRGGPPATEKFDLTIPPMRQRLWLMLPAWGLSYIKKWQWGGQLEKVRMQGLKPPYLLLANHNSFFDFYILAAALCPRRGIFPSTLEDFIGFGDWMWRRFGLFPTRKYTADIGLGRQCKKALESGTIFGIYPEARYSLCGLTGLIPDSVGQLARRMGVPVVTLNCSGHHIVDPFWGDHCLRRIQPLRAVMTQIYTAEEVKAASPEEINAKIRGALYNDDFRWQSENRVQNSYGKRAEGLHKPLYQCPHCGVEYRMNSQETRLFCEACGKAWDLNEYGELSAVEGKTEFKFASDWYEWEREQVRDEVRSGTYRLDCAADVTDLPNTKGFVHMGRGRLVHDLDGFELTGALDYDGSPFRMVLPAANQIAVHVEYNFRYGQGRDALDLSTIEDTRYVFPEGKDFSVTKISLATEEIFAYLQEQRQAHAKRSAAHAKK